MLLLGLASLEQARTTLIGAHRPYQVRAGHTMKNVTSTREERVPVRGLILVVIQLSSYVKAGLSEGRISGARMKKRLLC